MKTGYIVSGNQRLHYRQWGSGRKLLLAFHGYGNNAQLFHPLAESLAATYTTLSVDLPHHGNSIWVGNDPWTKPELMLFIKETLLLMGFQKLSLMGFSLGGRVCLNVMELMPELVEQLILIAPDGLAADPFYWFLTRNPAGRQLFQGFVERPDPYIRFVNWLHRRKWINASKHKFVLQYVSEPAAREFLRKVWPGMRLLVPDRARVQEHIRQFRIPTYIFMGLHDRIIPPRLALSFARNNPFVKVEILDKGHRLLDEEGVRIIASVLTPL